MYEIIGILDWETVPTVLLAILTVSDRWRSRRRAGSLYRGHRYVLFAGYRRYRWPGSTWRCWLCGRLLRRSTGLKTDNPFQINTYHENYKNNGSMIISGSHRCRHESVKIFDGPPGHFGRNWPAPRDNDFTTIS